MSLSECYFSHSAGSLIDLLTAAATRTQIPSNEQKIFKDECPFYFETAELPGGVYICMKYFLAVGPKMLEIYATMTDSHVFLHHQITKLFVEKDASVIHPTKLALGVPGGFELPQDRYKVTEHWALLLMPGNQRLELPIPSDKKITTEVIPHFKALGLPDNLAVAIATVICADSAVLAEERVKGVAAWEGENVRPISEHALTLKQLGNGIRIAPSGWKCSQCELRDNLWLNLTDGSVSCGRRFWDGSGGNNHAVEHYERTKYPLAVKLGTITPEGADVFSYAEDEMVTDPLLAEHLAHFGIDIMRMKKTDKTLAELEISANERLGEWRLLQESDRELEPRYGPGLTGLHNLGNTCYMNSVVQLLFAIPHFRHLFGYRLSHWIEMALADLRATNGKSLPVDHIPLQFAKLGHGLCSGAHSWLCSENEISSGPVPILPGIRPLLFRRLIGRHSKTFCTNLQQDAYEFLMYLLDLLDSNTSDGTERSNSGGASDATGPPSSCLRFAVEDRLECCLTHKVRYTVHDETVLSLPIPMDAMLNKCEYQAYENRLKEAEAVGTTLSPDDIVRPRIPFEACLSAWVATERVDDFITPASDPPGAKTQALRSSRLLNCPDFLCVQLAKYTVGPDWLPRKLDCEIQFTGPADGLNCRIDLASLRSKGGLLPGEVLMPDVDFNANIQPQMPNVVFQAKPELMTELLSMGFTNAACLKACKATNNGGIEMAATWIMEHFDDPTLNDDVVPETTAASTESHVRQLVVLDENSLEMLVAMGLTRTQAERALRKTNNDLEAAANWAFTYPDDLNAVIERDNFAVGHSELVQVNTNSAKPDVPKTDGSPVYELCGFISHMGKLTTHGHYVAHIRRSALSKGIPGEEVIQHEGSPPCGGDTRDEWIIFNDEKVAKSESPPHRFAYIYLFQRLDRSKSEY